jgi:CRP-like cAMP-binding protein
VNTRQAHRSVLYQVAKNIGQRLLTCYGRAEYLVFRNVPWRLARLLLRLAEEYGGVVGGRVSVELQLTQDEPARLIGATRQRVSLALRDMMGAGLIEREDRQLVLPNPSALRLLAEPPAPN